MEKQDGPRMNANKSLEVGFSFAFISVHSRPTNEGYEGLTMPTLFTTIRSCRFRIRTVSWLYGFRSSLGWHILTATIVRDTHPLAARTLGWTPCGYLSFRAVKESFLRRLRRYSWRCRPRGWSQLPNYGGFETL